MNTLIVTILLHSLFNQGIDPPMDASLRMQDILAEDQVFQSIYALVDLDKASIQGHAIEIRLYALGDERPARQGGSELAERVATVSTDSGGVIQWPMEGHSDEIQWIIPTTPEPFLGLKDANGGNCFNCEFFHLVSFADWGKPKVIGKVTDISDENGDGWDDLMTNENLLEIFCFSHADSPSIRIFWQIKREVLVPSLEPYRVYYEDLLISIGALIQEFMASTSEEIPDGKDGHLSLILQEFLIHRIVNPGTAWDALRTRLEVLEEKLSYLKGSTIEAGILERLRS